MYQRHSADEWQQLVSQWKDSTLSQKDFCKKQNIALTTFSYWIRKHSTVSEFEKGFVKIQKKTQNFEKIILHIGTFFKLEIPNSIQPERLQSIIQSLKSCL